MGGQKNKKTQHLQPAERSQAYRSLRHRADTAHVTFVQTSNSSKNGKNVATSLSDEAVDELNLLLKFDFGEIIFDETEAAYGYETHTYNATRKDLVAKFQPLKEAEVTILERERGLLSQGQGAQGEEHDQVGNAHSESLLMACELGKLAPIAEDAAPEVADAVQAVGAHEGSLTPPAEECKKAEKSDNDGCAAFVQAKTASIGADALSPVPYRRGKAASIAPPKPPMGTFGAAPASASFPSASAPVVLENLQPKQATDTSDGKNPHQIDAPATSPASPRARDEKVVEFRISMLHHCALSDYKAYRLDEYKEKQKQLETLLKGKTVAEKRRWELPALGKNTGAGIVNGAGASSSSSTAMVTQNKAADSSPSAKVKVATGLPGKNKNVKTPSTAKVDNKASPANKKTEKKEVKKSPRRGPPSAQKVPPVVIVPVVGAKESDVPFGVELPKKVDGKVGRPIVKGGAAAGPGAKAQVHVGPGSSSSKKEESAAPPAGGNKEKLLDVDDDPEQKQLVAELEIGAEAPQLQLDEDKTTGEKNVENENLSATGGDQKSSNPKNVQSEKDQNGSAPPLDEDNKNINTLSGAAAATTSAKNVITVEGILAENISTNQQPSSNLPASNAMTEAALCAFNTKNKLAPSAMAQETADAAYKRANADRPIYATLFETANQLPPWWDEDILEAADWAVFEEKKWWQKHFQTGWTSAEQASAASASSTLFTGPSCTAGNGTGTATELDRVPYLGNKQAAPDVAMSAAIACTGAMMALEGGRASEVAYLKSKEVQLSAYQQQLASAFDNGYKNSAAAWRSTGRGNSGSAAAPSNSNAAAPGASGATSAGKPQMKNAGSTGRAGAGVKQLIRQWEQSGVIIKPARNLDLLVKRWGEAMQQGKKFDEVAEQQKMIDFAFWWDKTPGEQPEEVVEVEHNGEKLESEELAGVGACASPKLHGTTAQPQDQDASVGDGEGKETNADNEKGNPNHINSADVEVAEERTAVLHVAQPSDQQKLPEKNNEASADKTGAPTSTTGGTAAVKILDDHNQRILEERHLERMKKLQKLGMDEDCKKIEELWNGGARGVGLGDPSTNFATVVNLFKNTNEKRADDKEGVPDESSSGKEKDSALDGAKNVERCPEADVKTEKHDDTGTEEKAVEQKCSLNLGNTTEEDSSEMPASVQLSENKAAEVPAEVKSVNVEETNKTSSATSVNEPITVERIRAATSGVSCTPVKENDEKPNEINSSLNQPSTIDRSLNSSTLLGMTAANKPKEELVNYTPIIPKNQELSVPGASSSSTPGVIQLNTDTSSLSCTADGVAPLPNTSTASNGRGFLQRPVGILGNIFSWKPKSLLSPMASSPGCNSRGFQPLLSQKLLEESRDGGVKGENQQQAEKTMPAPAAEGSNAASSTVLSGAPPAPASASTSVQEPSTSTQPAPAALVAKKPPTLPVVATQPKLPRQEQANAKSTRKETETKLTATQQSLGTNDLRRGLSTGQDQEQAVEDYEEDAPERVFHRARVHSFMEQEKERQAKKSFLKQAGVPVEEQQALLNDFNVSPEQAAKAQKILQQEQLAQPYYLDRREAAKKQAETDLKSRRNDKSSENFTFLMFNAHVANIFRPSNRPPKEKSVPVSQPTNKSSATASASSAPPLQAPKPAAARLVATSSLAVPAPARSTITTNKIENSTTGDSSANAPSGTSSAAGKNNTETCETGPAAADATNVEAAAPAPPAVFSSGKSKDGEENAATSKGDPTTNCDKDSTNEGATGTGPQSKENVSKEGSTEDVMNATKEAAEAAPAPSCAKFFPPWFDDAEG
ncbi:unnamed protein product [Amoebophrya sp. A120]|nr:unnamed protein product [Amoebophrya sp. A120]|eukprot:GSA120T00010764001.1